MSVLQRKELEDSPLADLHAIASELGLEGYRALRRDELVGAILAGQGGEPSAPAGERDVEAEESAAEEPPVAEAEPEAAGSGDEGEEAGPPEDEEPDAVEDEESSPVKDEEPEPEEPAAEPVSGVLDILPNGSGFVRVEGGGQSADDVYVSPAQIRRCELRAGDEVGGPVRPPRRSERHPSLVRVEAVNGGPAEPPEERPLFSALTPIFARERLTAPPLLSEVAYGRGSRVAIGGPPGSGATSLLQEVVATLRSSHPEIELAVVLVGVRPEEVTGWQRTVEAPVSGGGFDRSIEAQVQAAELAVERAKRVAERGGHAALVIDSLEALPSGAARRVFGAARNTEEGGSLTIFASTGMAWEPQRWATTRVMLEPTTGSGSEPSVSASRSATLRVDLLA